MNELFQRLKQRKLVQWAIAYVAAAFALLQGIDIVAQQFGWPEGVSRGTTLALVVGFFVALVIAWYHGERGAQRVSGTEVLIIGLVLTVGGGFLWRFAAASHRPDNRAATVADESRSSAINKSIAVLPFENLSEEKAREAVTRLPRNCSSLPGGPRCAYWQGQTEAAKSAGEEALPLLEARLREQPDDAFAMTELAWVYLALARNADALRLAREAAASMPVEKDAVSSPTFENGLAQIEARAGAAEQAVKRLRRLLSIPAGENVSIARLKIDPVWDPIRNRPDFQQLLSGPERIGPNK